MYICHIFFIHLSVNGHLGCFYVLPVVNSAKVSVRVHVPFELEFSPDVCLVMGLQDHMVVLGGSPVGSAVKSLSAMQETWEM